MNAALELRRGDAADAAAIRELTRMAYAKWVPILGREPLPMTADYDAALRKHRFDLLYEKGALIGLIETVTHPDHVLIVNVAVAPASQGRGHGPRLMRHAEQLAADAGVPELRLYTNKLFTANLALYARLGYRVDREEDFRGGIAVYMSKRV